MKKRILTMLSAVALPLLMLAQGWPAGYGGVMLQGFFWDSYKETPDCSPFGPWQYHQSNSATQSHQSGYTWATMYGAGWGTDYEEWQVPITTWTSLLAHKNEITPFIDLLWLPQSGSTVCDSTTVYDGVDNPRNGVRPWRNGGTWDYDAGNVITNPDCMGFVPVFYFHHGKTFNQDGTPWTYEYWYTPQGASDPVKKTFTPMSYHGTEPELRQLISEMKADKTYCIEDVVINHRGGLGNWLSDDPNKIGFPSEYCNGELIEWSSADVCSDDESDQGTGNADCGGGGQWARDIDHHSAATRAKVTKFLKFLRDDLGYEGFRYDYARGFEEKHFAEYNVNVRPTFSVGEFWGSTSEIKAWMLKAYDEGSLQSGAFDFPLHDAMKVAFNNSNWRALNGAGLINEVKLKRYVVTFVDNHDTFKDLPTDDSNYDWTNQKGYQHRIEHNILEANAFILAMPGTPCLFWPHYMHPTWHSPICDMIIARHAAGVTNESALWAAEEIGTSGIQWKLTGEKGEVFLQLGSEAVNTGVPTGFVEVWKSDNGRYSIKTPTITTAAEWEAYKTNYSKPHQVNGYALIDKQSGSFSTETYDINIKPSAPGCVVAYTIDGQVPTANSRLVTDADNGVTITLDNTATVKAGVVVDGKVNIDNVITREYIKDVTDNDGKTMVYIKAPWAPSLYAWSEEGGVHTDLTSAYPGWTNISNTREVGGVTWYAAEISSTCFNMIISHAQNADDHSSQSADINNVTSDVFYEISNDGSLNNVSNVYLTELRNPMVSIDKTSGEYYGNLTVKMTATYDGATIVYNVDTDDMPTASSNPTEGGQATVTFNTTGSHTLRAAILHDGAVINHVARTYYIHESEAGAEEEEWASEAVADTGINIYVHTSDDCETAPYLYVWDPNRYTIGESDVTHSYKPNGNFPGGVMTQLKKVRQSTESDVDANWKTYYLYHIDTDQLAAGEVGFILSDGNGNQTADQTITAPGSYFYDYNVSNYTTLTPVTNSPGNHAYVTTTTDAYQASTAASTGINVYVRRTDGGQPYVHYWDASLSGTPLDPSSPTVTPFVPGTKKKVDNIEWYYLHLDADAVTMLVTKDGKWGKTTGSSDQAVQSADQPLTTGTYFFEYNGNTTLNDVSANYLQSVTWTNVSPLPTTGYRIYVKASSVPKIYAWDSNDDALTTAAYPGDVMTQVRRVTPTGGNTAQEFYYAEFPANSDLAGFLISYDGDTDKSADFPVSDEGSYFVEYNGTLNAALTDHTSTYVTTTVSQSITYSGNTYVAPTTSGYNFYIKAASIPNLHAWGGGGDLTTWPGTALNDVRAVKVGSNSDELFYYYHLNSGTNITGLLVNYNGDTDKSADFTVTGEGNYFLQYSGTLNSTLTNLNSSGTYISSTAASTTWGSYTNPTSPETGVGIYVQKATGNDVAPGIHAWDGLDLQNSGNPLQFSEKRKVKDSNNNEVEYWYFHTNATSFQFCLSTDGNWHNDTYQSQDESISDAGNYFYTFTPSSSGKTSLSDDNVTHSYVTTSSTYAWQTETVSEGTSFYISSTIGAAPALYCWDGASRSIALLTDTRKVKVNGSTTETDYYYYHTSATNFKYIIAKNTSWNYQTADLSNTSGGAKFLIYAPKSDNSGFEVLSQGWVDATKPTSGVRLYVRTDAGTGNTSGNRPYIHSWNGTSQPNEWISNMRRVKTSSTDNVYYLENLSGNSNWSGAFTSGSGWDSNQTSDMSVSSAGNYFYSYNPNMTNKSGVASSDTRSSDFTVQQPGTVTSYQVYMPTTITTNNFTYSVGTSSPASTSINYTEKAGTQSTVTTVADTYTAQSKSVSAASISEQTYVLTKVNNFVVKAYQLNNIYKIYVHVIDGAVGNESLDENTVPYIYTFNPALKGAWPGTAMSEKRTAAGTDWWYVELGSPTAPSIIFSSQGYNQTVDITDLVVGDNYYNYYIDQVAQAGDPNKYRVTNVTEEFGQYFEIPSCATYLKGKNFFYFENDANYADPYAWVYNLTTVFSGSCWPGSELEVVGISSNGNTVYRWVYDGDIEIDPTNITFSDHGDNTTQRPVSGQEGYGYVNGGYYTSGGLQGVVEDNALSLADLIKDGTAGQTYVISNDLLIVGVSADRTHLYVKDADGDAIFKYFRTANQQPYTISYKGKDWTEGYDYDQSNWAIVELPEALDDDAELLASYVGRTIQAGSLRGYLKTTDENRNNPAIKATVFMLDKSKTTDYTLNVYYPANFMDQEDYFFMTPKPNELLRVTAAFYNEDKGAFYVPRSRPGVNEANLPGGVLISSDQSHYVGNINLNNLQDGKQYEVTAIAHVKYNIYTGTTPSQGAPRLHRAPYTDNDAVSSDFELMLVDLAVPDEVITAIDTVKSGNREVESVMYYNVAGMSSRKPFDGVNIVVTRYTDGSMTSKKVIK